MHENEIAKIIVDSALAIHRDLGPGLFESVYRKILVSELASRNLEVETEVPVEVFYRGTKVDLGFRADIIVCKKVIVETKSIEAIAQVHHKQLLTHLRLKQLKLGLLINFNVALLKNGLHRIVNGL
ncbi:MAG TPA: GxxExxY protein [Cyclobacteriaceae bacterium]|nr:GxxExxY protein [Cyclobacteriaceae bacterium]